MVEHADVIAIENGVSTEPRQYAHVELVGGLDGAVQHFDQRQAAFETSISRLFLRSLSAPPTVTLPPTKVAWSTEPGYASDRQRSIRLRQRKTRCAPLGHRGWPIGSCARPHADLHAKMRSVARRHEAEGQPSVFRASTLPVSACICICTASRVSLAMKAVSSSFVSNCPPGPPWARSNEWASASVARANSSVSPKRGALRICRLHPPGARTPRSTAPRSSAVCVRSRSRSRHPGRCYRRRRGTDKTGRTRADSASRTRGTPCARRCPFERRVDRSRRQQGTTM